MVEAVPATHVPGDKRRDLDTYPKCRYDKSSPSGGIILTDDDNSVTSVVKNMLYKMGANLLKGKMTDLLKISAPASIHLAKTYLHMI